MTVKVSLIVAVARGGVIGRDGGLPWRLPADLARFKATTMGHHMIVGRKTFEAIGRPLPGRKMIVVTRQPGWSAPEVEAAHSLDEALARAASAGETEAFVGGGGEIYAEALPRADRLYLTEVDAEVEGDAFFPPFDRQAWELVSEQEGTCDEANPLPHRFRVYERRRP